MTQSSNANDKARLAFYRAAGCGGCDITVTALGMRLVEIVDLADVVFWPHLMDFKVSDVEALDDGAIDVCFFNGAIRSSEDERVARLLRRKSGLMVAFGACTHTGGIAGLANLYSLGNYYLPLGELKKLPQETAWDREYVDCLQQIHEAGRAYWDRSLRSMYVSSAKERNTP